MPAKGWIFFDLRKGSCLVFKQGAHGLCGMFIVGDASLPEIVKYRSGKGFGIIAVSGQFRIPLIGPGKDQGSYRGPMRFDVEEFFEQFRKIGLAAMKSENGNSRVEQNVVGIMLCGLRMLQRSGIHHTQTITELRPPDAGEGRKLGVGGTDKDDFRRTLPDAFQPALKIQSAGIVCNSMHQTPAFMLRRSRRITSRQFPLRGP